MQHVASAAATNMSPPLRRLSHLLPQTATVKAAISAAADGVSAGEQKRHIKPQTAHLQLLLQLRIFALQRL